jgi:hypothetical protein
VLRESVVSWLRYIYGAPQAGYENEEDDSEENAKDEDKTRHRRKLWWGLGNSAFAVS